MKFLLFLLTLAVPATAEPLVPDAFGLAPPGDVRAAWAGVRGTARVSPGEVDRVLIVVGPKSLVAGKDRVHAVAIVLDADGNAVADETRATLRIGEARVATGTRAGLADHLYQPDPDARALLFGAASGRRQSTRAMVRVTADMGSVQPALAPVPKTIPHEAFFDVATGPLADRFGNAAEDGTAVSVRLGHGRDGYSFATATVTGGTASARFLSRDIAGPFAVAASLGASAATADGAVAPRAAAGPPDATVEPLPSIGAIRVAVGPFLTTDGFALGDGAEVSVEAVTTDGSRYVQSGWTRDGSVSVMLPVASPDALAGLAVRSPLGWAPLPGWAIGVLREVME